MKKILFRVDFNQVIGRGHLSRCLTLAKEFKEQNCEVEFICGTHSDKVQDIPFSTHWIETQPSFQISRENYTSWLGQDLKEERAAIINFLESHTYDLMVIDHYGYDEELESSINIPKLIFDDMQGALHKCDFLLNQNIFSKSDYSHANYSDTKLLLGPTYSLIRDEFIQERNTKDIKEINNIFLYMGTCTKDLEIKIDDLVSRLSENYQVTYVSSKNFVANIAQEMSFADIGIGSGGVTTWERNCVGLPTLVFTTTDNQVLHSKNADKEGVIKLCGDTRNHSSESMFEIIDKELSNLNQFKDIKSKGLALVDGKGKSRIVKIILESLK